MRPERGVTLIELVVAIVIVGIVVAAVVFFLSPLRQSTDIALRAELTDIAGNALQRIGRDVKLALPNSIRIDSTTVPGSVFLEFIAVRTAGRYRADGGGPTIVGENCSVDDGSGIPDSDQLVFDAADTCFTTMGKLSGTVVAGSDQLVLNNYGFADQNAYQTAPILNRVTITSVDSSHADRDRIEFGSITFQRALHDSPGKRFFVISGPVTYRCDMTAGTITRHDGYGLQLTQPTAFGAGALIAEHVLAGTGCSFDYGNVGPQLGLLTMRITLQRQLFGGASETVSLYHAVHVNNAP